VSNQGEMGMIDFTDNKRLEKQLNFIIELDKVKSIYRKSRLFDCTRYENDAEHSWTITIMSVLLREYANFEVDIEKVITMLLLHDVVEIDAGDTFLYSEKRGEAAAKEEKAAERIFGMLDPDQQESYLEIWKEFEERKTNESKFASVFDRLEPLLQNYITEGYTWKKHDVTYDMVITMNKHIAEGSKELWDFVLLLLDKAVKKGYLKR